MQIWMLRTPSCGMICKLVCDTKKVPLPCYGCKCKAIAAPGLMRPCGCPCQQCACDQAECCDACSGPQCDNCESGFSRLVCCPSSWFSCCCAHPRMITILTKRKAEQTLPSYHWEVVDCCSCCPSSCGGHCDCADSAANECPQVYKAAPASAQVGDQIELTKADRTELAAWVTTDGQEAGSQGEKDIAASLATATVEAHAADRSTH